MTSLCSRKEKVFSGDGNAVCVRMAESGDKGVDDFRGMDGGEVRRLFTRFGPRARAFTRCGSRTGRWIDTG